MPQRASTAPSPCVSPHPGLFTDDCECLCCSEKERERDSARRGVQSELQSFIESDVTSEPPSQTLQTLVGQLWVELVPFYWVIDQKNNHYRYSFYCEKPGPLMNEVWVSTSPRGTISTHIYKFMLTFLFVKSPETNLVQNGQNKF